MKSRYLFSAAFLLAMLSGFIFAQDKADDVIRIDTSVVNIPVIVSDRDNRYIPGLMKQNFRIFQDGAEQKIEVFSNDAAPMNIILALDTSRSTQQVLGKIKKAAKEFIKGLDADDRCMIVTFDYQVGFLSNLTSDKKQLDKAIGHVKIGEMVGTVLQDAVYEAVNSKLRSVKGRKAIILLTDGKDHGSMISKTDLYNQLNESDTVIYPIFYETGPNGRRGMGRQQQRFPGGGFPGGMGRGGGGMGRFPGGGGGRFPGGGRPQNRPSPPGGNGRNIDDRDDVAIAFLDHLAEITGGRSFKEKKADLRDAFQQISDEMKRQYLIAFYPTADSPAGTVHKVRVQVDRPDSVVRSKGAYRTQAK